ncbi:MAG: hypothetical protein DI573_13490 [Microbacterium sp.]|uniref:competence protein CoiA family protein n=1 Tax=Microbacterium sp. TaxID=51671 RepID=UPI000DB7D690|nr:competence protein CoiA family protein [Microbacterium sp.]PZU36511.1 MAG: hypothetical protein DI573_13490 [Microbacterium sp.]
MGHSVDEYRAFSGSPERRIVFAVGSGGEVEYMPDGAAPAFKERRGAGETFSCIVPDCESPMLKIVDRGEHRHGFSHVSGGGHDGMGVDHLQSQLLLQRWLRARYPSLEVDLERTTADGRRRADVLATSRATGAQIAFEVQYAGMTAAEWQARHDSYRDMGIVDVWLWGYGGAHFHPRSDSTSWISFGSTLSTVAHAGLPILFIDPAAEHIGYVTRDGAPYRLLGIQVLSDHGGQLQSEPLTDFWIDAHRRFLTDRLADLLTAPARVEEILAAEKHEADERERRRQEGYEAFYARVRTKAEALARRWPGTPEHRRILELFGDVPAFLKHEPTSGNTTIHLPVPPVVWQGKFFLKYIHGRRDGWRVSIRGMTDELNAMDRDVRFPEEAVRSWLGALEEHGHVARLESTYRYDKWPKYEVRAG